jgi:hypothetical protein
MSGTPTNENLGIQRILAAQFARRAERDLSEHKAPMAEGESWSEFVAKQTAYALCPNKEALDQARSATAAALAGIEPKDDLEVMLASLMIATYDGAIGCFQRGAHEKSPSNQRECLALGGKLARSYALLLDTLDRRRGKGTQTIRIERVNIEPGARAMVGIVNEAPGGGVKPKSESRRYETRNANASPPLPPLRSEDKERDAMPMPSNAERPLSDTRREGGGSKGKQE